MPLLQPESLSHGHYECRSLDETLPVFTDLLASEVVRREDGAAVVKHPNTPWALVVHEGGPDAPVKPHANHYGFRVSEHTEVDAAAAYLQEHRERYGQPCCPICVVNWRRPAWLFSSRSRTRPVGLCK